MKDHQGNHTTPKQLAQSVLMDGVCVKMEFFDESIELSHLTRGQKETVYKQALKLHRRICTLLQYESKL